MSLFTNGKARETQADVHRIQTDNFFDDFIDLSQPELEFLGEVETQNRVVQKNPAVFTGPLSVAAPPGSASKQGKLRKTLHQDQSARPPGFPNRSKAPAGDFRPHPAAAATITVGQTQQQQQQQQRPTPSLPTKQPAQKPLQPNPQPQPLTSGSQTTLQPVNERPAGGNQRPTSGVQAEESRSEGPTDPEKHADSELQDLVPTTAAAPEKRKGEPVDAALKKIRRQLSTTTTTPEDNDAGGVPEVPASDIPAMQRFYWHRLMARTMKSLVYQAQKI
ncbi:hypothetical protein FQA47_025115 [Oryzias melastigma]|uniref:Uncharacterized protein n=1 Tax=Oryzias melastigma TaxID=30732 RepID=A0A834EZI1_ORYME|nr:hypothetical protein FQA47_025115 [Oryzias melastigma]